MEKLTHTPDGKLTLDKPWWYRENQKVRLTGSGHGSYYREEDIGKIFILDGPTTENHHSGYELGPPAIVYVRTPGMGQRWAYSAAFEPVEE